MSVAAPFVFRYIMGMMLTDTTGTTWASAFNEMGEKMLGRSANDLAEMKKIGDETGCAQHARAAAHSTRARLRGFGVRLRASSHAYGRSPEALALGLWARAVSRGGYGCTWIYPSPERTLLGCRLACSIGVR